MRPRYAAFSRTVSGTGSGLLAVPSIELDRHEDHVLVAEIFQIVHLELAGAVGLVARLARDNSCTRSWCRPSGAGVRVRRSPRSRNSSARGDGSRCARRASAGSSTRAVLSVSDSSSEPTQPFGCSASRANSAFSAGVHSTLTWLFEAFSFMVIAMALLLGYGLSYSKFRRCGRNALGEDERALVIGGSMSGLLAALALSAPRVGRRGLRARRRAARRARRRHRGAAGAEGGAARARARCGPRSRRRGAVARDVRARRPRDAPHRMLADHDGVGPRLSLAESRAAGGELSPRQGAAPHRAGRAGRRAFRRRLARRGRPPGRRRRHPLDRAPAISARRGAALCRLHGVARAGAGAGVSARAARASCSRTSRSACPTTSRCSAIRWPVRTTICAPVTGATISSGTGRRARTDELPRLLDRR